MKTCRETTEAIIQAHAEGTPVPADALEHARTCSACGQLAGEEERISTMLGSVEVDEELSVSPALHSRIVEGVSAVIQGQDEQESDTPGLSLAFVIRTAIAAAAMLVLLGVVIKLIPGSDAPIDDRRSGIADNSQAEESPLVTPLLMQTEEQLMSPYMDEIELIGRDVLAAADFLTGILPGNLAGNGG